MVSSWLSSPWRNSRRHSTGAASRLAALLLPQILPDILGRRALRSGRIAGLGARRDLHHGLSHDVVGIGDRRGDGDRADGAGDDEPAVGAELHSEADVDAAQLEKA